MPKVSIIIPAYNVEMYIGNCLKSILHQTFNDIEVILINDGSKDQTLSICEQFIGKIPNLNIINKSNEGQAIARNVGTQEAVGNYICYIDADDWISPRFIETLYQNAIIYNADIIQCNHFYAYDNYVMCKPNRNGINRIKLLSKETAIEELIIHKKIQNFPWGKLIKRHIAQNCLFPIIKNFEDVYWFHKIIYNSSNYVILNQYLYYYRQRVGSMTASFNETSLLLLDGVECRLDFINKNYPQLSKLMFQSYFKTFFSLYGDAVGDPMLISEYKKRRKCFLFKYEQKSHNSWRTFLFKVFSSSTFIIRIYNIVNRIIHRLFIINKMTKLNYNQTQQYEN